MKTYKYNFFAKLIYRYAIIPVNLILIIYLIFSALGVMQDWKYIFPLLLNVILIYVLNKFYLKMYKTFPFEITVDNEKMICTNFVFNNRIVEIKHSEISEIKGGIFSGRAYMPLYLTSSEGTFGISPHITDYNKLITTILTNIPKNLYESLLDNIKKIAYDNTPKRKK